MKRLISGLTIFAVILILAVIGVFHLQNTTNQLQKSLSAIETSVSAQQYSKASEEFESAQTFWNRENKTLGIYMDHHLLDQITQEMARLGSCLRSQNQDEIHSQITLIQCQVTQLYENEMPLLRNIL
ncbi:MAG: DUF4363 family protein [Massiliimalia sp.]|jgi:hypothetical protein